MLGDRLGVEADLHGGLQPVFTVNFLARLCAGAYLPASWVRVAYHARSRGGNPWCRIRWGLRSMSAYPGQTERGRAVGIWAAGA